jgi:hypothetical protein
MVADPNRRAQPSNGRPPLEITAYCDMIATVKGL